VSLGRRFLNLVRSNLNALLDSVDGDSRLDELSDEELEAELERRRERRLREEEERRRVAAAERAAAAERTTRERVARERAERADRERGDGERTGRRSTQSRSTSGSTSGRATSGSSGTRNAPPRSSSSPSSDRLARFYATLETPVGADLATVKQNFRRLMRKYHPDLHAGDPERIRMATERSKQLTQAYSELERHLQSR
jgi:DnaJ-domain-containing protein 1